MRARGDGWARAGERRGYDEVASQSGAGGPRGWRRAFTRRVAAALLVAVLGVAAGAAGPLGCASMNEGGDGSGAGNGDGEAAPGTLEATVQHAQAEGARIRRSAQGLAAAFASTARALEVARERREEPAITRALAQLDDLHLAIEALDEAQGTLAIAIRYAELRPDLRVPDDARLRLDQDAAGIVGAAESLHRHVAQLLAAAAAGDAAARAGARTEVERDRAALKAYRTDLGITARLGS